MAGGDVTLDAFGAPVAGSADAVAAWDLAWQDALAFSGGPFARLEEANAHDEAFAMGSVYCGTYRLLAGAPPQSDEVQTDLARAQRRAQGARERAHSEALALFASGEFAAAARRWDDAARAGTDLAAVRFAHDVYLHTGDAQRRLASSSQAMRAFADAPAGLPYVTGMHAFSLEETGHYAEAENVGLQALEANPMDLWALHALAHVYESTDDQHKALALLRSRCPTWRHQHLLAVHIWWHLALRLIAAGDTAAAFDVHDQQVDDASTPFELCDQASLLWRLELEGADVGSRWAPMADAFAARPERHTCGFIDLHMALAFARHPGHPEADTFFAGVAESHRDDPSHNGETFRTVVAPLAEAIRVSVTEPAAAAELLDSVAGDIHRIGGSVVQRDLVALTRRSLEGQ